ncbi:MAG: EF-hand domain-containing protein [Rhodocyclaceae bacterium]
MVSSISGSSTSLISSLMQATRQKPSASELASEIFSKLDTSGQGYLEKTDFSSALSSSSGTSSSDADEVFDAIDEDGDGKVTESELADTLQKLSDQMDAARMNQAMAAGGFGGPPPPPPSDSDEGFTQDQLTSIAQEISSTDSERASFMSDIAANFDEADTDGDGKVSFTEAMAYKESQDASSSSSTSSASTTGSTSTTDAQVEQKVLQQIVQLIQAYGLNPDSTSSATAASTRLSVSA